MITYPDPEALYPDIAARGSLAEALRAVAERDGLSVLFTGSKPSPVDPMGSLATARAASVLPHRDPLRIGAYRWKRWWSFRGEEALDGLALVEGNSDDLTGIARIAQAWHDGATLSDIGQVASFVHLTGRFEVPDIDPERLTESEWQHLRTEAREGASKKPAEHELFWHAYAALVEAACAEPRLRALYPFTSHWTLRFSATTRPRLTIVGPSLDARKPGEYAVSPKWMQTEAIVYATPEEAVSAALSLLPPGLGPVALGAD